MRVYARLDQIRSAGVGEWDRMEGKTGDGRGDWLWVGFWEEWREEGKAEEGERIEGWEGRRKGGEREDEWRE